MPTPETKASEAWNKAIANATVMAQRMRQYHWYVGGVNFFDLHAEFGKLYDALTDDIDTWAERVRQLNDYPVSTLQGMLELADIKEIGQDLQSDAQMVAQTIDDLSKLLESLAAVSKAALPGDRCSDFIAVEAGGKYEKVRWMMSVFATGGTKIESREPLKPAKRLIEDMVNQSVQRHTSR